MSALAMSCTTAEAASGLSAVLAATEIGLFGLCSLVLYRRSGYTLAEAAAGALMTPLMVLSFLYQVAFILGAPRLVSFFEAALCLGALAVVALLRNEVAAAGAITRGFVAARPLATGILVAIWVYLGVHALFSLPAADPGGHLARLASWQAAGSFFAAAGALPGVPVNAVVLPHLFLRLGSCRGVALVGLTAYMAVGCATYALARRHAWPTTAFTVTLVTVSLPRMVVLSISPGVEIVPAAAAVFSLLLLYRLIERPAAGDLLLLIVTILCAMPAEKTFYVFPAVLALLSLVLLVRRHGTAIWRRLLHARHRAMLCALAPAVVFSQLWQLAVAPQVRGGLHATLPGAPFYQNDGIQGAAANLLRYLLQSIDFTAAVDRLAAWGLGWRPSTLLQGIYNRIGAPLFGRLGVAAPFKISWLPPGPDAWFGPFGFLLIIPAVAYALLRGSRRLKAVAVALAVYVYTVCLACSWTPQNARLFTVAFACGGFCTAFFLPPWRFSRKGQLSLQAVSLILMAYTAAHIT